MQKLCDVPLIECLRILGEGISLKLFTHITYPQLKDELFAMEISAAEISPNTVNIHLKGEDRE